jgi:SAM-dependent methyltransferase
MTRYVDTPSRSPLARALRKLLPAYRPSSMGGPTVPPPPMAADANVTDNGERVVPEDNNFCFQAHLSIYNFAKPYAHGKRILDAGCGTGYGSFHLLSEGKAKSVHGIDLSEKAIAFCRSRYVAPTLKYDAMNLEDVSLGGRAKFDLIFSSNVLEHVADADAFLATAIRLLTPDGVFVLGVPCVNTPEALEGNLENPYHINNITPPAWLTKVRRFFQEAQGYRHWVEPEWVKPNGDVRVDDSIKMNNFTFNERSDDAMMAEVRTITTILVARGPRPHPLPKTTDEVGYPAEWNVDLGRPRGRPEGVVGPINCDREVVQTFVSEDDSLDKVEVMMATYSRTNRCTVIVELHADSADGPTLARREVRGETLVDNDWLRVEFPTVENARGRRFALVLRAPDAGPDDAVTAYYTSVAVPGREALTVARREKTGNVLHFHTRWSKD